MLFHGEKGYDRNTKDHFDDGIIVKHGLLLSTLLILRGLEKSVTLIM